MTETLLVTRSEGFWHAIAEPAARWIETAAGIQGDVMLVAIDRERGTARLIRVVRGGPDAFAAWCRRTGLRPILPGALPVPAALAVAARPRSHA